MAIYCLGNPVANVALSDSFNTWRITTNKILNDAASLSGNNTFTGEVTFSGNVSMSTSLSSSGSSLARNLTVAGNGSVSQDFTANNITASSIIRANNFIGDGSLLTNAGSTVALDGSDSRTLKIPFTGISTGTMTSANVNSTFTFNPGTGQLAANSVKTSALQDSSGRTLTVRNESNTIVWGG